MPSELAAAPVRDGISPPDPVAPRAAAGHDAAGRVVARRVEAGRRTSGRRLALLQFGLCLAALLVVVGTVGALALRQVATTEALRDSQVLTQALGRAVVRDRLTPALLAGDPASRASMDRAVKARVLQDPIVRLKIWRRDGRVVYSDLDTIVGRTFPLSPDLREAFEDQKTHAEVTDLSQPENRFERGEAHLVEVYLPLRARNGERVVVEAYHRADSIDASAHRIWKSFLPVLLVLLVALAAAQLPLAWFLARRVRSEEREREHLARRGEDALEFERRRIAAALHDGVVQDLAGAAYELDAGAGRALTSPSESTPRDFASVMSRSATMCRQSIVTLRALLTDLFPAESQDQDLDDAVHALARPLRARGVQVDLDIDSSELASDTSELFFRVVREALRNVDRHAGARRVGVTVRCVDGEATLRVTDDGRGMTAEHLHEQHADGHMGLALLADGIAARGGTFLIESEPGAGTTLSIALSRR